MAVQTNTPILPIVFDKGMYVFNKRKGFLLTPTDVHLKVLPPIIMEGKNESDITPLRNEVRATYVNEVGEQYL